MRRSRDICFAAVAVIAMTLVAPAPTRSGAAPGAAQRATLLVAYPGPGWRYVNPRSGITFRGVALSRLGALRVVGSRSGVHPGRLHPLRLGVGTVYRPDKPFVRGERVRVSAGVRVYGARATSFSFLISRRIRHHRTGGGNTMSPSDVFERRRSHSEQAPGGCRLRRLRFHTLPRLRPVPFCLVRAAGSRLPGGKLLVTPTPAPVRLPGEQFGVMVLSNDGKLLWYSPRPSRAHDAKTVMVDGRRLLVFYQRQAAENGYHEFRDEHYRVVTRLFAGNGYKINAHDIVVTDRDSAFVSAYERVYMRGVGTVVDYVVQEIDLLTRDVLFEWHSLDHIRPSTSYARQSHGPGGWDYFHGNSIEPAPRDGPTIVVSARNTSAVYGIDRVTGTVLWRLGGKRDPFRLRARHPTWQFCAQHDARWTPAGDLTIFDNGGEALRAGRGCRVHAARVEVFRLNVARRTVRLVRTISSTHVSAGRAGYFPGWVGGARRQPDGDMLISWGTTGQITEVAPSGRVMLRLRLGRWTYRAARAPWTGLPLGAPRVAVRRNGRAADVWASWNGATQIRSWRVLAGDSPAALAPAGRPFAFADLETHMRVQASPYLAVAALDAKGVELGRSEAVALASGG